MKCNWYRLPDKTTTCDREEYATRWNALADAIAKLFPGYRVAGMDPGVLLFGEKDTVTLSVEACQALLSTIGQPSSNPEPSPAPSNPPGQAEG